MSEEAEDQTESSSGGFDLPPGSAGTPLHLDLAIAHALNFTKYKGCLFIAFASVVLTMVALIYLAFLSQPESFRQELSIVFAAGIATFLGTPIVIKLSSRRRRYVMPVVLILALGCGVVAYFQENPLRALLVEAGVSLILIVALEISFDRLLESLRETYRMAEEKRERELADREADFDDKVDEWNRRHGITVIGHGFGAIDDFEDPNAPKEKS